MKKLLIVLISLFLILALSSCGLFESKSEPNELEFSFHINLDSFSIYYIVEGIGTCTDTDIVIPSEYKGSPVTDITSGAFRDCTNIKSITIPDSVTTIGWSAFKNCTGLTSITIPSSVQTIGPFAFKNCTNLVSVTFEENSQLTSIDSYMFENCDSLTSITIPDSVTSIDDSAFYYCDSLYVVCNNSNIALEFGSEGNGGIAKNAKVIVDHGNVKYAESPDGKYTLDKDGFLFLETDSKYKLIAYCGGKETVTLPETFNGEGYELSDVRGCVNLVIPAGVTEIANDAFNKSYSLASITVDENNEQYKSIDGNLYTKDGKTLVRYVIAKKDASFVIPDGVESIGDYAFLGYTNYAYTYDNLDALKYWGSLKSVTIPVSVTSIGSGAFKSCGNLSSVTIPDSVTSIGDNAFDDCYSLTSVIFGENSKLVSIGDNAFNDCDSLTSVIFGENSKLASIGDDAFEDCDSLTSITIPDNVTNIGNGAFSLCDNLTSITIPNSVTSIGNQAFWGCNSLTNISIPNSVTSIGFSAFWGCESLTSIIIPDGVTRIGSEVFDGCVNLKAIYYAGSIEDFGNIKIDRDNFILTDGIHYYSETKPTTDGKFWHYVNGEIVVW